MSRHGLINIAILLLVLVVFAGTASAFRYQNEETGADYTLVGVGVLRMNLTDVDGDEVSFENTDYGLPLDYSNRSYLSLYGEGMLNEDWEFYLNTRYDQEDPDQEFRFLMTLKKDDEFIILGDHEEGTFLDTVFTLSDDELRGVTLHGRKNQVGGTLLGGAVRGESVSDEIRGDGTSGWYRLSEAPVIRGTERVSIEVRDRASPTRVIASNPQARGRDYRIDYDRGEILFTSPVDESDFRGNPIFIVVNYQFDSPGDLYKRSRYGARTTADLTPWARVGVTYLADGPFDGDFSSDAIDERLQIFGTDLDLRFDDRHLVNIEVAQSNIPALEDDLQDTAMRFDFLTTPVEQLRFRGNYWRVGTDFLTFGNRDLESNNVINIAEGEAPFYFSSSNVDFNLDPNNSAALGTDQESLGLSAGYDINLHTISAGFRKSRDNIPEDEDSPTEFNDSVYATLSRYHPDGVDYLLGTEFLFNSGEGPDAIGDSRTSRFVSGIRHSFFGTDWTGPVTLQGAYQYDQFDDEEDDLNSNRIHDLLGRVEILPLPEFLLYYEQGLNYLYEERESDFTTQAITTMVGFEGYINRYFDLDGSVRFRVFEDMLADERTDSEQTYNLRWTTEPYDFLRLQLRFEYREDEDLVAGNVNTSTLFGGQVWWDITSNLLLNASWDRDLREDEFGDGITESSGYDDVMMRLDWRPTRNLSFYGYYRIEYDEFQDAPLDATEVATTTELVGAKYRFLQDFEFVSAYRRQDLDDAAENEKLKIFGELRYDVNRYLSVAPGYEYNRYTDEFNEENDYEANVVYINLIGKL